MFRFPPLALRELGGCDETCQCAHAYLNVLYPETHLLPESVVWIRKSGDGDAERLLGVQYVAGFRVIGSMVSLHLSAGRLVHLSGRWLPSEYMESAVSLDLRPDGLLEKGMSEWGGGLLGYGVFHGSVRQIGDWEYKRPVLAFVVAGADADGAKIVVVEAETGQVLFTEPGLLPADFDTWEEANLFGSPDPQTVLMLDTQQVCGGPNPPPYPDCTYWPAHTLPVRQDVIAFDAFLGAFLDRDGWDDGNLSACPSGSPYCCSLTDSGPYDPHAYSFAANSVLPIAPFFSPITCLTVYRDLYSCPSVIGHEYGHGIDFSETRIAWNCTGTNICSAMGEGMADVVGIAFTQLWDGYGGGPWVLNDEYDYCVPARDLSNPVPPEVDHASNYDFWGGDPHDNGFVLNHGFYLLGRPAEEGPREHYGVSVTGIGIENAFQIYFKALTEEMPSHQNPSLSDLRLALLMAALHLFGTQSNEYLQTFKTVNAMGYWTTPAYFPQRFSGPRPDLGRFGSFANTMLQYPTVVYMEGGRLKYRYRYFDYGSFTYRWSNPIEISQSTGRFQVVTLLRMASGVPVGYDLHVFYQDISYYLRHYTRPYSGQATDQSVYRNGVPLRLVPSSHSRLVSHGGSHWIFYSPFGTDQVIMSTIDILNSTVGTGSVNTGVTSGVNNFEVGSDGVSLHIFYRTDAAGYVLQRKWGGGRTFLQIPPENSPLGTYYVYGDFDVESYLDTIHVVLERAVVGNDRGVVYMRCDSGCDVLEKWSRVNPIGATKDAPGLNGMITLAKDFTTEGGLTFGRQRPNDSDPMWFVTKFSK